MLLILDEVMCGMGRTGFMHAWQGDMHARPGEDVVPDILLVGKGLAGGYAAISAMLLSPEITDAIESGPGFNHGHTFQNSAQGCVAGLTVMDIIEMDNLLENVRAKGKVLRKQLNKRLGGHRYVGNIRGRGLFIGVSVQWLSAGHE